MSSYKHFFMRVHISVLRCTNNMCAFSFVDHWFEYPTYLTVFPLFSGKVVNHNPICQCPPGYEGNPFQQCKPKRKSSIIT